VICAEIIREFEDLEKLLAGFERLDVTALSSEFEKRGVLSLCSSDVGHREAPKVSGEQSFHPALLRLPRP